jgi:hypothetical protein
VSVPSSLSTWKEREPMPLPPLPVPKLEHTLHAIEQASAALRSADDPARQQVFSEAIDEFRHGLAPELEAALLNFAEHENAHGAVGSPRIGCAAITPPARRCR